MSHHAEWLSLLDISGPFLSIPVLDRVFPQGLDQLEADHRAKVLLAHDEWADEQQQPEPDQTLHQAWVEFVLNETLGLTPEVLAWGDSVPDGVEVRVPESSEVQRPDAVVIDPATHDVRMLVSVWPAGTPLDTSTGSGWAASPIDRMIALCRAEDVGVRLGLVTNGDRWTLVDAPVGETSAHVSWYAGLWQQEPLTLRAFVSLLGLRRFFGVADEDRLEAMLGESVDHQAEVTDKLGLQVRRAVEVLVTAIDQADIDSGRTLLAEVEPAQVYEAALTVMMRLVFLFSAEERGLLLLGENDLYDQAYALTPLSAQLRQAADQVGETVLENRQDAWMRLLSTFRAIHSGVHHEGLQIIPYGSSLFDPDRFPFLEGRSGDASWRDEEARPLPIDNRTVLLLLESLQSLDFGSLGRRRLSFRALDIEQIGHVYETLLDHTAVRATQPMVSLQGNQNLEPEVSVEELHALHFDSEDLVAFLKKELKKSESAVANALGAELDPETTEAFDRATRGDRDLLAKLLPFHAFVRRDPWGRPVVIRDGSIFVTEGEDRRSTGTQYTPRYLSELVVRHTLDPLIYEGPSTGRPEDQWQLRSSEEILALRVCDPAMGSGAFLVAVIRYLSERLLEAWDDEELGGLPADAAERAAVARLSVAEHCVFGVDINPMAVELAKLSVWLVTLARGRAFTFLDHSLKCGDSLLGLHDLDQLRRLHIDPSRGADLHFTLFDPTQVVEAAVDEAARLRKEISDIGTADVYDTLAKEQLHRQAEAAVTVLRTLATAITGSAFGAGSATDQDRKLLAVADKAEALVEGDDAVADALRREARRRLESELPERSGRRRPFHWPLEFPEVFSQTGFDAVVGNPPFLGGTRISQIFGPRYGDYLGGAFPPFSKRVDLAALFLRQGCRLLTASGQIGMIATDSIAEHQTRRGGLDVLKGEGWVIRRALKSFPWPGVASTRVSVVWLARSWATHAVLDGAVCSAIASDLRPVIAGGYQPERLEAQEGLCFQGSRVWGEGRGFYLSTNEAEGMLKLRSENREVLRPCMNGKDLNNSPGLNPARWIIDFGEKALDEVRRYREPYERLNETIRPWRESLDAERYGRIVTGWWKYFHPRHGLYDGIRSGGLTRVLARARVSDQHMLAFLPSDWVYMDKLVVFLFEDWARFGILQSAIHDLWLRRYGSRLGTTMTYIPSECFETFPLPSTEAMSSAGVAGVAEDFYEARAQTMATDGIGLTAVHNRISSPSDESDSIRNLRALYDSLARSVTVAFGLAESKGACGFHPTETGMRFTCSPDASLEIIEFLLELNRQRASQAST